MARQASNSEGFSFSPSNALYATTHAGEIGSPMTSAQNAANEIFLDTFIGDRFVLVLFFGNILKRCFQCPGDVSRRTFESGRDQVQAQGICVGPNDLQDGLNLALIVGQSLGFHVLETTRVSDPAFIKTVNQRLQLVEAFR